MRSKLLVGFLVIFAGAILWWYRPVRPHAVSASVPVPSPSFYTHNNSQTPPPPSRQPAQSTIAKPFAVHSGTPMPYHHETGKVAGKDSSPMQRYSGLTMSSAVDINGRPNLVLKARAVPDSDYNSSMGPVLFQQNGFSVVAMDPQLEGSWADMPMRQQDRPLVVSPANGRLGIVTGTVMVKFDNTHDADQLAASENLQLLHIDESIATAYYRAPQDYALLSSAARLRQVPGVSRVELEVVQGNKEAR